MDIHLKSSFHFPSHQLLRTFWNVCVLSSVSLFIPWAWSALLLSSWPASAWNLSPYCDLARAAQFGYLEEYQTGDYVCVCLLIRCVLGICCWRQALVCTQKEQ